MDQSYNTNDRRTIDEIASEYIAAEYRTDFIQFTKTGEAKPEFLAYLDKNSRAGEAVDIVFNRQAAAFEDFAQMLRKEASK